MDNFPPNSRRARTRPEEPKKIERVTSAEAVRRKKSLGRQFKETFINGSARSALHYAFTEVVIPDIRQLAYEAFESTMRGWIFGESRPRRPGATSPSAYSSGLGRFSYNAMFSGSQQQSQPSQQGRMLSKQARTRHDFGDIVIHDRVEAEEVLDQLYEILSRYDSVSVADLYDLTGIRSEHTDKTWGWYRLPGAKVLPLRSGGWVLQLPQPEPLG